MGPRDRFIQTSDQPRGRKHFRRHATNSGPDAEKRATLASRPQSWLSRAQVWVSWNRSIWAAPAVVSLLLCAGWV